MQQPEPPSPLSELGVGDWPPSQGAGRGCRGLEVASPRREDSCPAGSSRPALGPRAIPTSLIFQKEAGAETSSFYLALLRIQPKILHCWRPMRRTFKSYDEGGTGLLSVADFRKVSPAAGTHHPASVATKLKMGPRAPVLCFHTKAQATRCPRPAPLGLVTWAPVPLPVPSSSSSSWGFPWPAPHPAARPGQLLVRPRLLPLLPEPGWCWALAQCPPQTPSPPGSTSGPHGGPRGASLRQDTGPPMQPAHSGAAPWCSG